MPLTIAEDLDILVGLETHTVEAVSEVMAIPMEEALEHLSSDTILSDHSNTDFRSINILKWRDTVIVNNTMNLLYQTIT